MKKILNLICNEKFWITTYGAYDITPENLVFMICLTSDKMKVQLQNNDQLNDELSGLFTKYDYPEAARNKILIIFESQETVNREHEGSWRLRRN
ncbi:MAG: hypothetical protein ABIQ88_14945 [Chitinophagaceae bacterium]